MPCVIPTEMIQGAVQVLVCFVTGVAALFSLVWTARA